MLLVDTDNRYQLIRSIHDVFQITIAFLIFIYEFFDIQMYTF